MSVTLISIYQFE